MFAYAFTFLTALVVTFVLTPVVKNLAIRIGAVDKPDARKVHHGLIPRLGGLAIYAGFMVSAVATIGFTYEMVGIMLGATMGAGVYGSAVFTFLAQGLLVLLAEYIAPYLNDALILELSASGSLMILAIGTNMLNLTKFKVINMLPAFLVVPFALKLMGILGLS